MNLVTSQVGIDLLKRLEGFEPKAYADTGGKMTIGYGTLIDTVNEKWLLSAVIDKATGEEIGRAHV